MLRLTYDLETTGLLNTKLPLNDPNQSRIVQIGAILDDENGKEISRLDCVIYQHNPMPEGALKSHGITMERSQQIGVRESIAVELLLDMIEVADIIVGYNHKGFDNKFVTGTARRLLNNESFDPFAGKQLFDVMLAGKAVVKKRSHMGGYANVKLTHLFKHFFGYEFKDAHQAISDVKATRACFYKLQDLLVDPETMPEPVEVQVVAE